MNAPATARTASDGSVRPDRGSPTFERDVQRMFASIADRYDAFNHAATFGLDLLWRPRAVWELERFARRPLDRLLDVGCGTGGLARQLVGRDRTRAVVGADFSRAMVRDASRHRPAHPDRSVAYLVGHAGHLPFADNTFDAVASAFAVRNFANLVGTFRELRRVLRPRGALLALEVSEPASPTVGRLFHAHFDLVVPMLGRAFGREGPYQYLPASLRSFPPPAEVVRLLGEAGFVRAEAHPMSLGIVRAFLAEAPAEEGVKRDRATSPA